MFSVQKTAQAAALLGAALSLGGESAQLAQASMPAGAIRAQAEPDREPTRDFIRTVHKAQSYITELLDLGAKITFPEPSSSGAAEITVIPAPEQITGSDRNHPMNRLLPPAFNALFSGKVARGFDPAHLLPEEALAAIFVHPSLLPDGAIPRHMDMKRFILNVQKTDSGNTWTLSLADLLNPVDPVLFSSTVDSHTLSSEVFWKRVRKKINPGSLTSSDEALKTLSLSVREIGEKRYAVAPAPEGMFRRENIQALNQWMERTGSSILLNIIPDDLEVLSYGVPPFTSGTDYVEVQLSSVGPTGLLIEGALPVFQINSMFEIKESDPASIELADALGGEAQRILPYTSDSFGNLLHLVYLKIPESDYGAKLFGVIPKGFGLEDSLASGSVGAAAVKIALTPSQPEKVDPVNESSLTPAELRDIDFSRIVAVAQQLRYDSPLTPAIKVYYPRTLDPVSFDSAAIFELQQAAQSANSLFGHILLDKLFIANASNLNMCTLPGLRGTVIVNKALTLSGELLSNGIYHEASHLFIEEIGLFDAHEVSSHFEKLVQMALRGDKGALDFISKIQDRVWFRSNYGGHSLTGKEPPDYLAQEIAASSLTSIFLGLDDHSGMPVRGDPKRARTYLQFIQRCVGKFTERASLESSSFQTRLRLSLETIRNEAIKKTPRLSDAPFMEILKRCVEELPK